MSQKVTGLGYNQPNVTVVSGKAATVTPPKPASGAGGASTFASAAPEGYIGWNPGPDVPMVRDTPTSQPTNLATL